MPALEQRRSTSHADGHSGTLRSGGRSWRVLFYLVMGGINGGIVAADASTYRQFPDHGLFAFVRSGWVGRYTTSAGRSCATATGAGNQARHGVVQGWVGFTSNTPLALGRALVRGEWFGRVVRASRGLRKEEVQLGALGQLREVRGITARHHCPASLRGRHGKTGARRVGDRPRPGEGSLSLP